MSSHGRVLVGAAYAIACAAFLFFGAGAAWAQGSEGLGGSGQDPKDPALKKCAEALKSKGDKAKMKCKPKDDGAAASEANAGGQPGRSASGGEAKDECTVGEKPKDDVKECKEVKFEQVAGGQGFKASAQKQQ